MPTAEEVFSETFGRFMLNWSFITSLRQVSEVAFPIAEKELAAIHAGAVQAIATDPDYSKIILNLDGSCNQPEGFAPIENYSFDRAHLDEIDNRRHRIIHADGLRNQLGNVDDDLTYVIKTGNYLMGLVNQKYGVRVDPLKVLAQPATRR